MYRDQHNLTTLGTARILSRNAVAYEDYLQRVLGRPFVLANPVESHGPMRMKARFVTDKAASGEKDGPFIDLWIEFNPAMGLYTVSGEYFVPPNVDTPVYTSSPRSGFDDEMLADPIRLFDWLKAVTDGFNPYFEQAMTALAGMQTPAGALQSLGMQSEATDGGEICLITLEPEYRIPQDYYVSGTDFPGPLGGLPRAAGKPHVWQVDYQMPIQNAVQSTLDNLYGEGAFDVEVDAEGYVYVTGLEPIPPQDGRTSINLPIPSIAPKVTQAGERMESKTWYTDELLRMAGVDGSERLTDRYLSEGKKKPAKKPAKKNKFQAMAKAKFPNDPEAAKAYLLGILRRIGLGQRRAASKARSESVTSNRRLVSEEEPMNTRIARYLENLAARLEAKTPSRKTSPRMEGMCEMCGCEMAETEDRKMGNGKLLCEKCRKDHMAEAAKKQTAYDKLVKELGDKGVEDPKALAAWIGRKKLGKEEFQQRAAEGAAKARKGK